MYLNDPTLHFTVPSADSLQVILSAPQTDLTATDDDGWNVTWHAVLNSEDDEALMDPERCVQVLCDDPRVDWNTRSGGRTPLFYCLEAGKEEMAKILLGNPRVDLNVQNGARKFPETIAR